MIRMQAFSGVFLAWALAGAVALAAETSPSTDAGSRAVAPAAQPGRWFRGALHFHSFWSDGDDFPEMVVDWHKRHGYDFVAPTEHNVIARGEKWHDLQDKDHPIPNDVLEKCRARFGPLEVRDRDGKRLVRLRTLDEVRTLLESPGRFLVIPGEEISSKSGDAAVHLNAFGLRDAVEPIQDPDVVATLRRNVEAVARQARATGRTIPVLVNHPSWPHFDVSAEDLAATLPARLFEICNASEGSNRLGDAHHPSLDRIWDVANTLRIAQYRQPPLLGVATDDAHHYQAFAPDKGNPGRGWVMVRAAQLAPEPLLSALAAGDFYSSTGVLLDELSFDPQSGTLTVAVRPQPGARYTIDFIGTPVDYDRTVRTIQPPPREGKPVRPVVVYSKDVGKVLASVEGTRATYRLTGRELYVRAAIRSTQRMPNPPKGEGQFQEAWTQPVGWEKRVK